MVLLFRYGALFLAALILAGRAEAGSAPSVQIVEGRLQRVVDGDTVRVSALIWVDQTVDVSVRIDGVDAPEIFRPKCAREKAQGLMARDFVQDFFDGETVRLLSVRKGKYAGRVVARVERGDGADLGQALIKAGLAAPYKGKGPRTDWCRA